MEKCEQVEVIKVVAEMKDYFNSLLQGKEKEFLKKTLAHETNAHTAKKLEWVRLLQKTLARRLTEKPNGIINEDVVGCLYFCL